MNGRHYDPSILLKCECSDANWQRLKNYITDWAQTHEGQKEDPRPTMISLVVEKNGDQTFVHNAIFTPFNTGQEKDATLATIAQKHVDLELVPMALAFTSAAWIASRRADEPHVQPRDDPNRREAIIIALARLRTHPVSRECEMWNYPVTRDAEGKAHLGELEKPIGGVPVILDRFYRFYFERLARRFKL